MDDLIHCIPSNEYKIIGVDLNGHVRDQTTTTGIAHGWFGLGEMNKQGEEFLDFAARHSLNTREKITSNYLQKCK